MEKIQYIRNKKSLTSLMRLSQISVYWLVELLVSGLAGSRTPSISQEGWAYLSPDLVVMTEDGVISGFDPCGRSTWTFDIGKPSMNAFGSASTTAKRDPRMIPATDGSLYVVFPPENEGDKMNIAHVNATIMTVVAESPFSTPAFPNSYLTGSKIQTFQSIDFDDSFTGWTSPNAPNHLEGRRLLFSVNQWTMSCIDTSTQQQKWGVMFAELPPITTSHLDNRNVEHYQVDYLSQNIEIQTSRDRNSVVKKITDTDNCYSVVEIDSVRRMEFKSQILGVYALIDPPDTDGNLALVLVGKNTALPTNNGGLPNGFYFSLLEDVSGRSPELPGIRVGYPQNFPVFSQYHGNSQMMISRSTASWDPSSMTPYLLDDPSRLRLTAEFDDQAGILVSQFKVIDFLSIKFGLLSWQGRVYLIAMTILFIYIVKRIYEKILTRFVVPRSSGGTPKMTSSISIVLPDGTSINQLIPDTAMGGAVTISSPVSSSSNRLVLIPSEAIHPYEVLTVGQADTVEFAGWQTPTDVASFDRKIRDISSRLKKLPFAPSRKDDDGHRPSIEDSGNMTVLFLGRNVDEPKLVFRNPRAECEIQRPNIPIFTQSIRNAVAASALRDVSSMKAYVPRALCGYWNTFQGVFQEYVSTRNSRESVSITSFMESPQSACDTAFLILLLRDTDAHDGNYVRDLRRKVALFDLGCSLGDRPIESDIVDRMCLENFEIWKRVPFLLDVPFSDYQREYLKKIDFDVLMDMWKNFEYHQSILDAATTAASRLVHPTVMLRILQMHARFLLACSDHGRTILFAAEVMYSGMYDDVWIEAGDSIDVFETRLIQIAVDGTVFPNLSIEKGQLSEKAKSAVGVTNGQNDDDE